MDHVALTPYPMPADAPHLMPYQACAFNGDGYVAAEVLRLRDRHGVERAVETGTCLGSTTWWLSENFVGGAASIEADEQHHRLAKERLRDQVVLLRHARSEDALPRLMREAKDMEGGTLCFLDAHWGQHNPLLQELAAIAAAGVRPVIVIHDFQVPDHPELGFDHFPDGRPINIDLVKSSMDRIYGEGKWSHHTNTVAEGAMRGVGYFEPIG